MSDERAAVRHLLSEYRTYRKIACDLTEDFFKKLILAPCHYCGRIGMNLFTEKWTTQERKGEIRFQMRYNGLDRKDNTRAYTKDNVVTCCIACNKAKGKSSYEEFIEYLKCVASHWRLEI